MALIVLLSGPNLNLLGEREPEIYGTDTLAELVERARTTAESYGHVLEHLQSNHEGELIDAIQHARKRARAIVINAGALTHYSWSIHDALATFDGVIVELHISDPTSRETWRHVSVIEPVAGLVVKGLGPIGYEKAIEGAAKLLSQVDG